MKWVFIGIGILIFFLVSTYAWFVAISFGVLFRRPLTKKQLFLKPLFGKEFSRHLDTINRHIAMIAQRPHEDVTIMSASLKLSGKFFENKNSNKIVIFVHGYYSSGMRDIGYLGQLYMDLNVSLLVIDQRANGASQGVYTTLGAMERFDIREWIFYLDKRFNGQKDIYLHGVSMGAATSLLVTALNGLPKSFKGVIADCGYSRTNGVLLSAGKRIYKIRPKFLYMGINLFARFFAGFNLNKVKISKELKKNHSIPILFIHGSADVFVPYNMSVKNYKATSAPKKLVRFEGAAHCESYLLNPVLYTKEVKEFLHE